MTVMPAPTAARLWRPRRYPLSRPSGSAGCWKILPFGPGDEADALLARADAAMYRNKRAKPPILHPWVLRSA